MIRHFIPVAAALLALIHHLRESRTMTDRTHYQAVARLHEMTRHLDRDLLLVQAAEHVRATGMTADEFRDSLCDEHWDEFLDEFTLDDHCHLDGDDKDQEPLTADEIIRAEIQIACERWPELAVAPGAAMEYDVRRVSAEIWARLLALPRDDSRGHGLTPFVREFGRGEVVALIQKHEKFTQSAA